MLDRGPFPPRRSRGGWICAAIWLGICGPSLPASGQIAISGLLASYDDSTYTNDNYSTTGGGGNFPTGTRYDIRFNEGSQDNLIVTGFEVGGDTFNFVMLADIINLERVNNVNATGNLHIVLYEDYSQTGTNVFLRPSYAATMMASLRGSTVNRGADNVFANTGDGNGNNNNIERIDYIFPDGFPVFNNVDQRGFLVMDRGGNDRFKIAAITALDGNGRPAAFGTPVSVLDTAWGDSGISIDTTVMKGYTEGGGVLHPTAMVDPQPLSGVFVTWQALGLQTNDFIYGYSLAGNDVSTSGANWTNVANGAFFPTNTSTDSAYGGLDLISGGMMFFEDDLNVEIGDRVWDDWDGDGIQETGEAGISNVLVQVYDSHTNLAAVTRTDANGHWLARGIGPGTFFVQYTPPSGYQFSPPFAGTNAAVDSNAATNTGRSGTIALGSGETNLTLDAGMHLAPGDLRIDKTANVGQATVGEAVAFTLTVTNPGPETVNLTQVSDLLPPALVFTGYGASAGTYDNVAGIWNLGTLVPGASATLTVTGTVQAGYGGNWATNVATISRMDRPDTNVADNADSAAFYVPAADLAVSKVVDDGEIAVGESVLFTVAVTNLGPDAATGVAIADLLPTGLTFAGAVASQGSYDSGSGTWTVGALANGGSATLALTATAAAGTGGLVLTNTAAVSASSHDDPVPSNNGASAEVVVLGSDLAVTKTVDKPAAGEGDTVTFTVEVENLGPADTTGVTLLDTWPSGLTYASNWPSQGNYDSGTRIWTVGTLTNGGAATLRIAATVNGGTVGTTLTNSAGIATSDQPDPHAANDADSATVGVSSLRIDKTSDVSGSVQPGGTITYTIVVTNYGASTHSNVTLADAVPAGTTFVPGSATADRIPSSPPIQTSITYSASSTFAVPAGVTSVTVEAWGGGGGGATRTSNGGGGGGGGGAYSRGEVAVLPGSNCTVNVGTGGAANTAGGDSWFALGSTTGVLARGGSGGTQNSATGASGGSAAIGIGSPLYDGGNGANGVAYSYGGGGGSSAGTNAAGNNATSATGATAPAGGGNGGNGRSGSQGNGSAGSVPGGGGGGALRTSNGTRTGGAGAAGRMVVSYEYSDAIAGTSGDPPDLASGWELKPGQSLVVTFQVTVDDPLNLMAITNTASATSTQQTIPLTGAVVDPFVPVDLGLGKAASETWISEADPVQFTITLTNLSTATTATGVEVSDLLPAGFAYVSNVPSQGTYSDVTGIWAVGALAPLATATLTMNATAAVGSGGLVWTNVATVAGLDQVDLNPANDSAQASVGVRGADLAISKSVDNPAPNEGAAVTYTIAVTNRGPSATTGVEVEEPLTNGLTYVSHSAGQGTYNGASGLWTIGTMASGQVATLTITASVDAGTMGTFITNVSRIAATDMPDPIAGNDADDAFVNVSGLKVTKTSGVAGYAMPGSNVAYTIVVTNLGGTVHTGLDVADWVPTGTTYVADSARIEGPVQVSETFRDEFNAQAYTNNDGSLEWNDAWQENDPAGASGPVGNYVGVSADGRLMLYYAYVGDERAWRSADLSGFDSATLRLDWETIGLSVGTESVSVLVSTNANGPFTELAAYSGTTSGSAEFDITAYISTNTTIRFEDLTENWESGEYAYFDNVEIEAVHVAVTNVPADAPPALASGQTLGPGQAFTITFDVTVDNPCATTQIVNVVSVTGDQQTVPVTDTVEDPVAYTDLALEKSVDDPHPNEGGEVAYTIAITNKGPIAATGVAVSEPLASGLTYVSHGASQGTYDGGSGAWTVGSLDVGATAFLTITASVDAATAGTVLTNRARISATDQADPTPEDNEDAATIAVAGVDIGVGKSVSPAVALEKEIVDFAIAVTNFGPDAATGVVLADALPAGLVYVSSSASQGTYDGGTGLWTVGALAVGQVETLSVSATVQTNTAGTIITNVALLAAVDQTDVVAANNSASVEMAPETSPLDIFKSVLPAGTAHAGDVLTYAIVVTNVGSAVQSNVAVTDLLPAGATYVPGSLSATAPQTMPETFRDEFGARVWTGNSGTTNWTAGWVESEGNGPTSGGVQILFDNVRGTTYSLQFSGSSQTLARQADLSGAAAATLSFDYRRVGLEAGEYVAVQMSSNGTSGTWTEIGRFEGAATDAAYANFSADVSAYVSGSTAVRFVSTSGMDTSDILWIDDVQIEGEWRESGAWPGGTPPNLLSNVVLLAGETATITYAATVDSPATTTPLVNVASVTSTLMTQPRTDRAEVPVEVDWAELGDRVWFDANGDGIQDAAETNGIANLTVDLMFTNGTVAATVQTDADGYYLFTNVAPASYWIRVDLAGLGWVLPTAAFAGADAERDSDFSYETNGVRWAASPVVALDYGDLDASVDLGLRLAGSTRADLAEVWGESVEDANRVVWRTDSEWNTAGFFVYRVDPETGGETRLNDVLVPSVLAASGGIYELADPKARKKDAAIYRLEEIELSGAALDLGTHPVAFKKPSSMEKAARAEQRALAFRAAQPMALPRAKRSGTSGILKAVWREDGLYALRLEDVAAGMGSSLTQVEALAAANGLALSCEGMPLPVLYDAARSRLVFHGRATDDWYTRDNAALISAGAGLAMPRRTPGAASGETVFPVTAHFEQDRYPFDSAAVMPEDFYYWDYVISGHATMGTRTFALDLTGAAGNVALKVRLMGWSSTTNDPDHLAEFTFNGQAIGSATFDGQEDAEVELTVPAAAVTNGINSLAVVGTLQPGRTHSYFVVDWVEATFARELIPLSGTAYFRAGGAAAASAEAFGEPLAVALDADGQPTWVADENGTLPDKAWAALPEDDRYAVAESAAIPELELEPVDDNPWFLAETNRIDYLVLTSRELEPAARELADYRTGQGLRTGLAVFEDVCDWMMDGLRTPEAIPELLAYAQRHWTMAPWLVALAGNGHYDFLGALSNEVNHVPPLMLQTQDGIFAADGLMTDTDGDRLPDVAVGRLPAITTNDLAAMIQKIKAYEAGFGQNWQNQLVLATDVNDPAAGDFAAANAQLAALSDDRHPVLDVIDLNATAITPAHNKLISYFNSGAGLIHYTGHGGVANFSAKGLLKSADVAGMNNPNRPPVAVALSCLVGRYESPGPTAQSLGEVLMRKVDGGAVAVWGPSGLSRNSPALQLGDAFYRNVMENGIGILGLAVQQAVRQIDRTRYSRDTLSIYNLLGDPALRIADNLGEHVSCDHFAQWRWQEYSPQELADSEVDDLEEEFADYALGTEPACRAELPEFGYSMPEDAGKGFVLRWKRRMKRADVEYRLFLSHDLATWEENSPDMEEVGSEPDPDGVMETVRTRIRRTDADRTYLGIKAKLK